MSIPVVANNGLLVVVTFTAPNTHYSAITAYDVEFKKSDGTFGALTC